MSIKAKKGCSYLFILLFIAYFGVVGAYFVLQTVTAFRLWEIMILISGLLSFLFFVSFLDDTEHNTYWILSLLFITAVMITTCLAHFENILTASDDIGFRNNDYLAWGIFYGAASLCAAFTIPKENTARKASRITLLIIAGLCFAGLLGPLIHMDALWFLAVTGFGPVSLILTIQQLKYLRS